MTQALRRRFNLVLCLCVGVTACASETSTQDQAPVTSAASTDSPDPGGSSARVSHYVSVSPTLLPDGSVQLTLGTSIPGEIEVMAGLSLQNQAPDDVWIGKSERVALIRGKGAVTVSTEGLPAGAYDAEINFYPRWGFQDPQSKATGIDTNLSATASIRIGGSGATPADAQFKENGQRWVMENVSMGDIWRSEDWIHRFGSYEELTVDRGNPSILKAYFFPRIDATIIVNAPQGEISIWRLGRANH